MRRSRLITPPLARSLRLAVLLFPLCPAAGLGGRALAQESTVPGDGLPAARVEAILAGQGYVGVTDLRRRGTVWVAEVSERNGRRFRAVVDAGSGEVSGLRQMPGLRTSRAGVDAADASLR